MSGTGFQAAKLVDQGLIVRPKEECDDDVCVDDIREGVASLGEPTDVILQGLVGLLLAALEVIGVSRVDIRPLEISNEDPLEVRPVTKHMSRLLDWKQLGSCKPMLVPTTSSSIKWMLRVHFSMVTSM